jgi:NAD-dependent SIR2 family protein deacetylase
MDNYKIGIRNKSKKTYHCLICKKSLKKYIYVKLGKGTLRYCEKCGKLKYMNVIYYNKKEGKKYGINRRTW